MHVDYSVYLVTDNTPAILGKKDIVEVVRAAVEGGSLPHVSLRHLPHASRELIVNRRYHCPAAGQDK